MKHISFYQWLLNCGANTQNTPGKKCTECDSRGFTNDQAHDVENLRDSGFDAFSCCECGDEKKYNSLRVEYLQRVEKDAQTMKSAGIAAALLLCITFWACPPPRPTPDPTPEPPKRLLISDFDGFHASQSTFWDTSFVLGCHAQPFGGVLTLSGSSGVSSWVSSRKAYRLDSLQSFKMKVDQTTGDFAAGVTPAGQLDRNSTNGAYHNDENLRLYFYRKPDGTLALFEYFKETGRQTIGFELHSVFALSEPAVIELAFNPRLRRMYLLYGSGDGLMQELGSEILGPSWGDSVAFEISAHDTPKHGEAKVDWANIEYYVSPADTTKPVSHKAKLIWNRNAAKDSVLEYVVEKFNGDTTATATPDTFMYFNLTAPAAFHVRARNMFGISGPSSTVRYPQDTLR